MSKTSPEMALDGLVFEPAKAPESWHAYIAKSSHPGLEADPAWLTQFAEQLFAAVSQRRRLVPSLWIDTEGIEKDGGSHLVSDHVRDWKPISGFALDPGGPSPRTFKLADLMDSVFGTPPKIYDRTALFVSAATAALPAFQTLAGRGLVTIFFFPQDTGSSSGGDPSQDAGISGATGRFMQNSCDVLEPLVTSSMFRNHRFYLPLLSAANIAGISSDQLRKWLGGAEIALRERDEAGNMLLLSTQDLAPVFEELGLERLSPTDGAVPWGYKGRSTGARAR